MTSKQAQTLMATLCAAFPQRRVEEPTIRLYVSEIARLPNAEQAARAIQAMIREDEFFPTIARIRDEYRRHVVERLALNEPELTSEQRAANLRRLREMAEVVGRPL